MGDLAAERLKGEKFHVFRIKGLDPDPRGGRVNARNEKPAERRVIRKPLVVEHLDFW